MRLLHYIIYNARVCVVQSQCWCSPRSSNSRDVCRLLFIYTRIMTIVYSHNIYSSVLKYDNKNRDHQYLQKLNTHFVQCTHYTPMARLQQMGSNYMRTIVSVLPDRTSPSRNDENIMSLSPDTVSSRPVHRVNGRVALRKPDHSVRPRSTCPFRFRLAWWSKTEPPKYFEELCENCKVYQENKLGKILTSPKFYR